MNLINTSILSAISTIIRIITGFISVKVVSVYIGPSGLALVGQMQNFIGMINNIASAGINSGVVKYIAEYRDNEKIKQKILSSALKISIVLILPIAILIIFFSDYISLKLLKTYEYKSVFILFAITIFFFVMNGLLISILNGEGEIKKLTILNITGSLFGLLITLILVRKLNLYGALISGIVAQSIVFFITLMFVIKSKWFKLSMFLDKIDKEYRNKLLKYSFMTLVSAIMVPMSHIYIRNYIGTNLGWNAAGYWQAIWKISDVYLILITTTLSIYYLPKFSSIQDKTELKKEIIYGYKIIMPIVIIMAICIYIFRDFIIKLLFTKDFLPMKELFLYQLIGDVIKIASWLLGYIMLAKAMTKLFVISEVIFVLSFVCLGVLFIKIFGLIGITIAFMINYLLYLLFLSFSLRGYLGWEIKN
jgi:PST family polysaccharide transporter